MGTAAAAYIELLASWLPWFWEGRHPLLWVLDSRKEEHLLEGRPMHIFIGLGRDRTEIWKLPVDRLLVFERFTQQSKNVHIFILFYLRGFQHRGGGPPLLFPNSEKKQNSFKLLNHTDSR